MRHKGEGYTSMNRPKIEEHKRADDEKIFDLQKLVYPDHFIYKDRELTRLYWQWRHYSNPDITSRIYVIKGGGDGVIAGMRPISFMPIRVNGKDVSSVMLTAVITHPDYRRKGIFSSLVKHSMKESKDSGASFAFTFPNEKSYAIYSKKREWRHIGSIPLFAKIIDLNRVLQSQLGSLFLVRWMSMFGNKVLKFIYKRPVFDSFNTKIDIRMTKDIDNSYDQFWHKVSSDYSIIIKRDANYLRWRYLDNPVMKYDIIEARDKKDDSLKGYIVTTFQERYGLNLGLIIDMMVQAKDEQIGTLLIAKVTSRFNDEKVAVAGCLMQKNQWYTKCLRNNGFLFLPQKINPREFYVLCSCLSEDPEFERTIFNFDDWHLTWGDTDNV